MRQERHGDLVARPGGDQRIDALLDIAASKRQRSEERLHVRKEQSAPSFMALEAWLREQRTRLSSSSAAAKPIDYMLRRWDPFASFVDDGRICLTKNAAERARFPSAASPALSPPSAVPITPPSRRR